MAVLRGYSWPGNVRELQSVIRQAVLDTTGPVLFADALPQVVHATGATATPGVSPSSPADAWEVFLDQRIQAGAENLYDEAVAILEKKLISKVLTATKGKQADASKILGITRTTLRTKIQKLGISIHHVVHSDVGPQAGK